MNEMIDYILRSLKTSDQSISNINRCILAQNRLNNMITIFTIVAVINFTTMKKQINKLTKEIEELKSEKGE